MLKKEHLATAIFFFIFCSSSSMAAMSAASENVVSESDILSRRTDATVTGFFESFRPSLSSVSTNLPEVISKEMFALCKFLKIPTIDWLDYFTKWSASVNVETLYHHGEETDSEEWFENEGKMKSDFSKFVGLLLYIRENSHDGAMKNDVNTYLVGLCDKLLVANPRNSILLRDFSPIVSYATFADKVLKGEQSLLSELSKTKNESVIYSVPIAVLDNINGKDTLWNPKLTDYCVVEPVDWKFIVLTRLSYTVCRIVNPNLYTKVVSVLSSSRTANLSMSHTALSAKLEDTALESQRECISEFFQIRALILGYCLELVQKELIK